MGFRIDFTSVGAKTRICVAGELLAEGVGELKQAVAANLESLELDLSELKFADSGGVEALRRLINGGATAVGTTPFIEKLLAI